MLGGSRERGMSTGGKERGKGGWSPADLATNSK